MATFMQDLNCNQQGSTIPVVVGVIVVGSLVFAEWAVSTALALWCFARQWLTAEGRERRHITLVTGLIVAFGRYG